MRDYLISKNMLGDLAVMPLEGSEPIKYLQNQATLECHRIRCKLSNQMTFIIFNIKFIHFKCDFLNNQPKTSYFLWQNSTEYQAFISYRQIHLGHFNLHCK